MFWEKQSGSYVHPSLFTKVLGRTKKNRRKSQEELEKLGGKIITKASVKMHCSIFGNENHNKKDMKSSFLSRTIWEERFMMKMEILIIQK
jgi:NAD-dependent DNA ligase